MKTLEKTTKDLIKQLKNQKKSLILDVFEVKENGTTYNFTHGKTLEKLDIVINTLSSLLEYHKNNQS